MDLAGEVLACNFKIKLLVDVPPFAFHLSVYLPAYVLIRSHNRLPRSILRRMFGVETERLGGKFEKGERDRDAHQCQREAACELLKACFRDSNSDGGGGEGSDTLFDT
jgi:hypothetical protein